MRIGVIGANGQLGSDVCKAFEENRDQVTRMNHADLEIADASSVLDCLGRIKPDLVVNTAAMHNVEACEAQPDLAFSVNGVGARNLALAAAESGFTLVHVSTDYVFDGAKKEPYLETDAPLPLNVYANSKLSGEYFVRTIAPLHCVVRVSGLYGINPCRAKGGRNFVTLMLKLARERDEVRVVDDEVLTPTYTWDIARQLVKLASSGASGLFHVSAQGSCSWYRFAAEIFDLCGIKTKLSVAGPGEFPAKVPRPSYSVLDNGTLQRLGIDAMPHWTEGLRSYLKALGVLN